MNEEEATPNETMDQPRRYTQRFNGHKIVSSPPDAETELSALLIAFRNEGESQYTKISFNGPNYTIKFWWWIRCIHHIAFGSLIDPLISHGFLPKEMVIKQEYDEMVSSTPTHLLREKLLLTLDHVDHVFYIIENYDRDDITCDLGMSMDAKFEHCANALILSYDKKVDIGVDMELIDRYILAKMYFGGDRLVDVEIAGSDLSVGCNDCDPYE